MSLTVAPVTADRVDDFVRLFESRGAPHYCWCQLYRDGGSDKLAKREAMLETIAGGTPVGVMAYDHGEPVGWCSVAPRVAQAKLERSRKMAPQTEGAWAVMCFFVLRSHRGEGVAAALLDGAIEYAQASGAAVIEAFPWDTSGTSATHRGHSSLFAAAGFVQGDDRWTLAQSPI